MSTETTSRPFYWERKFGGAGSSSGEEHSGGDEPTGRDEASKPTGGHEAPGPTRSAKPPGAELAALRRGIGREPGSVPQMWRFYTQLTEDGRLTRDLRAEHTALTLFAIHQQSEDRIVHRPEVRFASAMQRLRQHEKSSAEAVDRRFAAAATATSFVELSLHLRGLVTQLRAIHQGFDYTRLYRDLRRWQLPDGVSKVRRQWGASYFTRGDDSDSDALPPDQPDGSDAPVSTG